MIEYTAGNGIVVKIERHAPDDREYLTARDANGMLHGTGSQEGIIAFSEYFGSADRPEVTRRDAELGRYRSRPYPWIVVYPERDGLHWVVDERTGNAGQRNGITGSESDPFANAAKEYVQFRGGRWVDAQVGEVWVLAAKPVGDEILSAFRVTVREEFDGPRRCFEPIDANYPVTHLGLRASCITDGRRIWPEAS